MANFVMQSGIFAIDIADFPVVKSWRVYNYDSGIYESTWNLCGPYLSQCMYTDQVISSESTDDKENDPFKKFILTISREDGNYNLVTFVDNHIIYYDSGICQKDYNRTSDRRKF